jgi:hypothetical protein
MTRTNTASEIAGPAPKGPAWAGSADAGERARITGRAGRLATWTAATLVLGAVFLAYLDPHTMVDLSNRVWSCFQ